LIVFEAAPKRECRQTERPRHISQSRGFTPCRVRCQIIPCTWVLVHDMQVEFVC